MAGSAQKFPVITRLGRLMRKLAFAAIIAAVFTPAAFAENITAETVTLRALDKVTAHTEDFTVKIGSKLTFGTLDITTRHCEFRPPEETPETYAFIQIKDRGLTEGIKDGAKKDSDAPEYAFSGWMFASNPALSALDHPVYDVWVLRCSGAPQLRD